jgi:hypothetical protein
LTNTIRPYVYWLVEKHALPHARYSSPLMIGQSVALLKQVYYAPNQLYVRGKSSRTYLGRIVLGSTTALEALSINGAGKKHGKGDGAQESSHVDGEIRGYMPHFIGESGGKRLPSGTVCAMALLT